jgi:exosome complex exonuclease RRP6
MTNDEIMLDAPEETPDAIRAREKAARKAARKQKKKDDAAAQAAGLNYGDEPAFDYANAKSVLHAEDGDGKKKKKDKKKKNPAFAPFSGMSDAPKGLPRAQKEVPGRSRTFKS